MWTWGRAAFSALSGGGQSKAGVAYKSSQPATEAAPTSSAENAAALMSNQDSIDILDPSAAPDQSSAPEAAQSDASMGGRPSAGCVMENNGNGGAGNSSAEPANGCVAGVLSAREQVLLCASDELECLFQRLGVEHFPVLECVCSTWRKAIRSARMLGHEYLLYPNEAYPLPRTPGGIVSPSAVCVLPNGELVVTDTGNDQLRFVNAKTGAVRLVVGRLRAFLSSHLPESTPHVEGEFDNPMGVVADLSGEHVFVADTFKHRLVKLRVSDGVEMATKGAHGIWPQKMIYPQGVAVCLVPPELYGGATAGEAVFVCDSDNNRLQVFRATNLELLYIIGSSAGGANDAWLRAGPTRLGRPRAITVHYARVHESFDRVTERFGSVKDAKSRGHAGHGYEAFRVSALELNGQRLFTIGGKDTPLGRFHSPYGLCIFDGRLIVAEGCNADGRPADDAKRAEWQLDQKRLRVLSLDDASPTRIVQTQMLHPKEHNVEPRGLSATDKHLFMADCKGNTVHVFSIVGAR